MKEFLKELKSKILVYDGSKGYMLQKAGMKGGECPELWNVTHANDVREIYRLYKKAGADVIQTNTFQGNRLKLREYSLEDKTFELNYEGARIAREVMGKDGFVAASIGPLGKLFEPYGDLTFEQAYEVFREQVKAVVEGGVDIINFETFTDLAEMRAALFAAKETTDLPIICSMSYEANGKTLMGSDPFLVTTVLKSLGVDVIGTNCSSGPSGMVEVVKKMATVGDIYISVKPNAGIPEVINGETVYSESPESFSSIAGEFVKYGARLVGGCCGTTPEYISAIKKSIEGMDPVKLPGNCDRLITSDVKLMNLDKTSGLNVGKIDADTDLMLKEKLTMGDMDYITDLSLEMADKEYEAFYFNLDGLECDERILSDTVKTMQTYLKVPLILEAYSPETLHGLLRGYKGKAGVVISVDKVDRMEEILAVAKKYGSTVVDKKSITKEEQ